MSRRRVRMIQFGGAEYGYVAASLDIDYAVVRVWLVAPDRRRQLHIAVLRNPTEHLRARQGHSSSTGQRLVTYVAGWEVNMLLPAAIDAGWQPDTTGAPACFTQQIHASGNGFRLVAGMPGPDGVREKIFGGRMAGRVGVALGQDHRPGPLDASPRSSWAGSLEIDNARTSPPPARRDQAPT